MSAGRHATQGAQSLTGREMVPDRRQLSPWGHSISRSPALCQQLLRPALTATRLETQSEPGRGRRTEHRHSYRQTWDSQQQGPSSHRRPPQTGSGVQAWCLIPPAPSWSHLCWHSVSAPQGLQAHRTVQMALESQSWARPGQPVH